MATKRKTKKRTKKRATAKKRTTKSKKKTKTKTKKKTTRAKARKTTRKKKTTKRAAKGKRKPNVAFMRPLTPSSTLAAIVGSKPLPRTEVTKKLWGYIKKNKLQDAVERRFIIADAKLKALFGGKGRVNMFEMTKHVAKHLK